MMPRIGERNSRRDARDAPNHERITMKTFTSLFIAAAATLSVAAATTAPARADAEFAWCAFLNTQGGSQSCLFATIDQCRAYIAGAGFCQPNPRAQALAQMPRRNGVR
jgi:hypothetical protein